MDAYLTQLRLDRAKALLREGKLTVAQVAHAVGYEDPISVLDGNCSGRHSKSAIPGRLIHVILGVRQECLTYRAQKPS